MPGTKFHLGVDANNQRVTQVASPSTGTDAANRDYVDQVMQGINDLKDPVRAATTAAVTLSGTQTIDGVALVAGDRVLVKNQADATTNGIYVVAAGAWARASDADSTADVTRGFSTTVLEGTNKGTSTATANPLTWVLNSSATNIVLGTTALTFSPVGGSGTTYTAGAGIGLTGTEFTVAAGSGLAQEADGLRVDYAIVARKAAANNINATTTDVVHNFGHSDVTWSCRNIATGAYEFPDVSRVDDNTTRFTFATAPAAGAYRLVVQG